MRRLIISLIVLVLITLFSWIIFGNAVFNFLKFVVWDKLIRETDYTTLVNQAIITAIAVGIVILLVSRYLYRFQQKLSVEAGKMLLEINRKKRQEDILNDEIDILDSLIQALKESGDIGDYKPFRTQCEILRPNYRYSKVLAQFFETMGLSTNRIRSHKVTQFSSEDRKQLENYIRTAEQLRDKKTREIENL